MDHTEIAIRIWWKAGNASRSYSGIWVKARHLVQSESLDNVSDYALTFVTEQRRTIVSVTGTCEISQRYRLAHDRHTCTLSRGTKFSVNRL
jgi:hypothetical protein